MLLPPPHPEPSWSLGPNDRCRSFAVSPLSRLSHPPRSPHSSYLHPHHPHPRLLTSVERQRSRTPWPSCQRWLGASPRRVRGKHPASTPWTRTSLSLPLLSRRRSSRGWRQEFRSSRVTNNTKCHRNDFSINNFLHFAARSNAYFSFVSFLLHTPCMMSV